MSAIKNSLIYIFIFTIVIILSAINDSNLQKKDWKKGTHFFSAAAIIIIPAIMAGLRNPVVGTDTQVYAVPLFDLAVGSSTLENVVVAMP